VCGVDTDKSASRKYPISSYRRGSEGSLGKAEGEEEVGTYLVATNGGAKMAA